MVAVSTISISSSKLPRTTSALKMVFFALMFTCDCQATTLRLLISRLDLGKLAHGNLTYCRGAEGGCCGCPTFLNPYPCHGWVIVTISPRQAVNREVILTGSLLTLLGLKQWHSQLSGGARSTVQQCCCTWVSSNVTRSKLGLRSAFAICLNWKKRR